MPQNCEVAARSPPLAAGRTDARNGPARIGLVDRSSFLPGVQSKAGKQGEGGSVSSWGEAGEPHPFIANGARAEQGK